MSGRAPKPSRSRVDDDGGDGNFRGIMIGYLGLSDEGVYMGDVEPSGDDLPSGRVPGRAPEPSRSRVDDDGGDGTFRGFLIGCLGFSDEEA